MPTCLWQMEKEMTCKIAMDARPGGPAAKREPSPEGLGISSEDDLSAVGAALNLALPRQGIPTQPFRAGLTFSGRPSGP
jgi:hypothetical protein